MREWLWRLRAMWRRDATEGESRTLRHGGPLPTVGIAGPSAVFDPAGDVLAVVSERDGRARPEVVLVGGDD